MDGFVTLLPKPLVKSPKIQEKNLNSLKEGYFPEGMMSKCYNLGKSIFTSASCCQLPEICRHLNLLA